jgi:hypothetical protein
MWENKESIQKEYKLDQTKSFCERFLEKFGEKMLYQTVNIKFALQLLDDLVEEFGLLDLKNDANSKIYKVYSNFENRIKPKPSSNEEKVAQVMKETFLSRKSA